MKKHHLIGISAVVLLTLFMTAQFYFTDKVIHPPHQTHAQYLQKEPSTPPSLESLNITYREFTVKSFDGVQLKGWFVPGTQKLAILLLHGHGSNRMQVMKQVAYLHRAGYPLALFDFRGSGESSGRHSSLGLWEGRDARAVADYLAEQYGFQKFAGIGFSMGASAGLYWAAHDARVQKLVLDSPNAGLVPVTRMRGRHDFPFLPDWFYKAGFVLIRLRLGLPQEGMYLQRVVKEKIKFPVLYIQGTRDDLEGTYFAKELHALSMPDSQLWEVPGAGHVRSYEVDSAQYEKKVLGYLGRP
jgi:pimeloyl-ACP methyl ester carboxylesterase